MSQKEATYYVNGKFVPKSKAAVSVLDLGLVRGYGAFVFLVTYGGKPFLIDKHIERLLKSANYLEIENSWNPEQLKKLIIKTLEKNKNGKEKTIKVVITGGISNDGIRQTGEPTLAVFVENREDYPRSYYSKGIKVITADYIRHDPEIKNLDYRFAIKALKRAKKGIVAEVIYTNKKTTEVYEGTRSNLFLIKNGIIYTPKNGVLNGITRSLVIKLGNGITKVREKKIKIDELYNADEIFITSTTKQIMPVIQVNEQKIGKGKPGNITKRLVKKYKEFIISTKW